MGAFFRDHPEVQAVYGDSIWIDANGEPIRPKREMGFNRFVFLHDYNYLPQPSTFWRRSLYEAVGGLRADFHVAMDNDLWERFSMHTPIAHMQCYLSCMRFYAEQKTVVPEWRQRGHLEGTLVRKRGSLLARRPMLRPFLGAMARAVRVVQKTAAGGYSSSVPPELLPWLKAHATHET